MPRPLNSIVSQIRSCIENQSVATMLIQTEDLEVLCGAAESQSDMSAETQRADANGRTCAIFYAALKRIAETSTEAPVRKIALDAMADPLPATIPHS